MTLPRFHIPGPLLLVVLFYSCDRPAPLAPGIEAAAGGQPAPTLAAPSNTNALAVSWSQINVAWQDNSSNETGFEVHRSTTGASGRFALFLGVGGDVTAYNNNRLAGLAHDHLQARPFLL